MLQARADKVAEVAPHGCQHVLDMEFGGLGTHFIALEAADLPLVGLGHRPQRGVPDPIDDPFPGGR